MQAPDKQPGAPAAPMTSDPPGYGAAATGRTSEDDDMTRHESPESTVRPIASGAGVSLVQNGWTVIAADGDELGSVIRIDDDRLVVDRVGLLSPGTLIIPRQLIEDEDEGPMQVFLSIDSDAADQFAGEPE